MKSVSLKLFALLALVAGVVRAELVFESNAKFAAAVVDSGYHTVGVADIKIGATRASGETQGVVKIKLASGKSFSVNLKFAAGASADTLAAPETEVASSSGSKACRAVLAADAVDMEFTGGALDGYTLFGGPKPTSDPAAKEALDKVLARSKSVNVSLLSVPYGTAERPCPVVGLIQPKTVGAVSAQVRLPTGKSVICKGYVFSRWGSLLMPVVYGSSSATVPRVGFMVEYNPATDEWGQFENGKWSVTTKLGSSRKPVLSLTACDLVSDFWLPAAFLPSLEDGDYVFSIGLDGESVKPASWLGLSAADASALHGDLLAKPVAVKAAGGVLSTAGAKAAKLVSLRHPGGATVSELRVLSDENPGCLVLKRTKSTGLVKGSFLAYFLQKTGRATKLVKSKFEIVMVIDGDKGTGMAYNKAYGALPVMLQRSK